MVSRGLKSNVKEEIEPIISAVEKNKRIQGHICINDSRLFDVSVRNGVYGFPGQGNTTINNLKVTAWRAISSLYNIGPEDLIFLYRTLGDAPGAQEFHGIFRVSKRNNVPLLLLHCQDEEYLPRRQGRQYLHFRFLFERLTRNPISIPNDLRNKTYKKNNNMEVIKALSETDPNKPRLWGFRHPSVMNIGAARKSSIVAISNSQVKFLLGLLSNGVERPTIAAPQGPLQYNPNALPSDCVLLDDEFISGHFSTYIETNQIKVEHEAELYAYIIGALKNPRSSFHQRIIDDFKKINADLPFDEITENVILEMVITPHIQEEVDILLCDSDEKNFLILEVKNDILNPEDVEQAEKYIQLVNQRFPNNHSVSANIIGLQNKTLTDTQRVKLVNYKIEEIGNKAAVTFTSNV